MSATFTREEKARVISLARELGVSATALYRELNTALPTRERETVREVMEAEAIRTTRRAYAEISREVTERCKTELTAARNRREYKAAARILAALPGKGLMLSSGTGNRVTVYAVTDRRGTSGVAATVEVVRADTFKLTIGTAAPVVLRTEALLDVLADVLPARKDSTITERLRIKRARGVKDTTGELATPGSVMGDERDSIAGKPHAESAQGQRDVSNAHKAERNRIRVERFRAKQRAARIAADGRTHALRPAEVPTVGDTAVTAPKPVLITESAPVYRVPAPNPGKTAQQQELERARELRAIAKAAREADKGTAVPVTAPVPVPAVTVPAVTEAEAEAEAADRAARVALGNYVKKAEAASAEDAKFTADMFTKHPELFPEADGTLF